MFVAALTTHRFIARHSRGVQTHLPQGATPGDAEYLHCIKSVVVPIINSFRPDVTIVAAGFSAAKGESGGCGVTPLGYAHMTRMLMDATAGKMVLSLEEGSNIPVVAECVLACLKALIGETVPPLPADAAQATPDEACLKVMNEAVEAHVVPWREVGCSNVAECMSLRLRFALEMCLFRGCSVFATLMRKVRVRQRAACARNATATLQS